MVQLVQQQLMRAQQRQKVQADKHRTDRTFVVGDQVYLKLQPYVQASLVRRANHKLSFKYFGPFPIIQKINPVVYRLQLPAHSNIHPVFHVSLLKKAVSSDTQVSSDLPDFTAQSQVPVKVLQRRLVSKPTGVASQVLIQWSAWPPELATWEDEDSLRTRFPAAKAWGQALSQGGKDVTPPLKTQEDGAEPDTRRTTRPTRKVHDNPRVHGPDWVN